MDKFINLGKPTKRGIKRCPSCNTINGTRGARCKNKKCNIILRDNNIKLINTSNLSNIVTQIKYEHVHQQNHQYNDSIKLITDSPLELISVRLNNRGNDYRSLVELPTIQDTNGKIMNFLHINSDPNLNIDLNEINRLLIANAKCYGENCYRHVNKIDNNNNNNHDQQQISACQHVLFAVKCIKEAQPLQLKSSSLSLLEITNELKTDIMHLACNTSGPLVQRISKETFAVKCINEDKYPFCYLHVYFHDVKDKNDFLTKKFSCTCSYFKKMLKLKICDIPLIKRHCIHYYSALATFLSDEELSKEFEYILFNRESNENEILIKQQKLKTQQIQLPTPSTVLTPITQFQSNSSSTLPPSSSSSPSTTTTPTPTSLLNINSNNIINNNIITNNMNNNTINNNININTVNISNITNNTTTTTNIQNQPSTTTNNNNNNNNNFQSNITSFVNIQKKQLSINNKPNEEISNNNNNNNNITWSFIDWLSNVTEQLNETMHYQLNGHSNTLIFRIPNLFFDCLQERIALATASSNANTCAQNKKLRMPNSTQEIERRDVPPLGLFTKYTWNIYNILHVKSIFDTNHKSLDLQRLFIQKSPTTFEYYQQQQQQMKNDIYFNKQLYLYKTYLKVGKMRIDQIEQSIPFIIEWIPNLYQKSQIGELILRFEFGHLKPNETLS